MEDNTEDRIQELIREISLLNNRQLEIQRDLQALRQSAESLKRDSPRKEVIAPEKAIEAPVRVEPSRPAVTHPPEKVQTPQAPKPALEKKQTKRIEEFIGTNLLNKLGIAILVIGIAYGVEYSIEHELINPLTRVILGYLSGGILIAIALRMKAQYKTFSAVLLSGGMAVLYFVTYAAYDYYALLPQVLAFVLMFLFTVFVCFAALKYDTEVIAIIGMVGAYAVPFLLSDGSGRVVILLSYTTLINCGILVLAFKKDWRILHNLAFFLSWTIISAWCLDAYESKHLWTVLIFSTLFFGIFYVAFLAQKLIKREQFSWRDTALIMLNSFIYYGLGYFAIDQVTNGELYLGLFTVFNATLHFSISLIVFKNRETHKDIFFLVAGLVLVFLTLAVPVQLDGNWVTLIWAAESVLLFWVGRVKGFKRYEQMSFILIALAFFSLLHDWNVNQINFTIPDLEHGFQPFMNINFFSSMAVGAAFIIIFRLSADKRYPSFLPAESSEAQLFNAGIGAVVLLTTYFTFYKEIQNYWLQRYNASGVTIPETTEVGAYMVYDEDLTGFKDVCLIIYSALYAIGLSIFCLRYFKKKPLSIVALVISTSVLLGFLMNGLLVLANLRSSYLQPNDQLFNHGAMNIIIRYLCIASVVPLLFINRRLIRLEHFPEALGRLEKVFLHVFLIALLSSELIHWLDLAGIEGSDKLALSILWGVYALGLIINGLRAKERFIRILAIVLFGVTILKLFFYDIADMSTIGKTIVMVILGVLLLVASFLYNKMKKSEGDES